MKPSEGGGYEWGLKGGLLFLAVHIDNTGLSLSGMTGNDKLS